MGSDVSNLVGGAGTFIPDDVITECAKILDTYNKKHGCKFYINNFPPSVQQLYRPSTDPQLEHEYLPEDKPTINFILTNSHWLTVVFQPGSKSVVSIYDSLESSDRKSEVLRILQRMYRNVSSGNVNYIPVTQQGDDPACGAFAVAVAICVLKGMKPEQMEFDGKQMRKHLKYILKLKRPVLFPTVKHSIQLTAMTQESVYDDILKNAVINHNSQEMGDITSAMDEMLNRLLLEPLTVHVETRDIFTREKKGREVNFRVSRLQQCGSMAEKTSLWKSVRRQWGENKFIEFDYLAVLEKYSHEINIVNSECSACKKVVSLENGILDNDGVRLPLKSALYSRVVAMCNCTVNTDCTEPGDYKPDFSPCDKCTVVRETGRLQIAKSPDLQGSFIFYWISNTNSLLAPNIDTLQLTEEIKQLVIRVDVMPALEYSDNNGEDQDRKDMFVILKECPHCYDETNWMVSYCMYEISAISSLSVKHRNCYIIIKFLYGQFIYWTEYHYICKPYHAKLALLKHCKTCRDDGNNYTNCIKDILRSLLKDYISESLQLPYTKLSLPIPDKNRSGTLQLQLPVLCMLNNLSDVIPEQSHSVNGVVDTLKQTIRRLLDGKLLMSSENDFPVLIPCSKEVTESIIGKVLNQTKVPEFPATDYLRYGIIYAKLGWLQQDEIKSQEIRFVVERTKESSWMVQCDPLLPRTTIRSHVQPGGNSDNARTARSDSAFNDELMIDWSTINEEQIKRLIERRYMTVKRDVEEERNIKQRYKKQIDQIVYAMRQTGGGPPPTNLTPVELTFWERMCQRMYRLFRAILTWMLKASDHASCKKKQKKSNQQDLTLENTVEDTKRILIKSQKLKKELEVLQAKKTKLEEETAKLKSEREACEMKQRYYQLKIKKEFGLHIAFD